MTQPKNQEIPVEVFFVIEFWKCLENTSIDFLKKISDSISKNNSISSVNIREIGVSNGALHTIYSIVNKDRLSNDGNHYILHCTAKMVSEVEFKSRNAQFISTPHITFEEDTEGYYFKCKFSTFSNTQPKSEE
jgi:hypothetical protein